MSLTRREFVVGSAALAAGATVTSPFLLPKYHSDQRSKRSRVSVLHAQQYSQQLDQIVLAGLRLFPIDVRGKTVLLKPNLVDYIPGNAINTHPLLVLAATESFRRLGAKSVLVAEGPGHQRDTQLVLSQSGYAQALRDERIRFVDLNRDQLIRTPLRASYTETRSEFLGGSVRMLSCRKFLWRMRTVAFGSALELLLRAKYGNAPKDLLLLSTSSMKIHYWDAMQLNIGAIRKCPACALDAIRKQRNSVHPYKWIECSDGVFDPQPALPADFQTEIVSPPAGRRRSVG